MEDKQIVDLFWQRSEAAIVAAASKYGKYCSKIAYNILQNYNSYCGCFMVLCVADKGGGSK